MTDIMKCTGVGCPYKLKFSCHRFMYGANTWQRWFTRTPYKKKIRSCEFYWRSVGVMDACDNFR